MPKYLVAIHHPDNYNPPLVGEEMVRDIDVLNEQMEAGRDVRTQSRPRLSRIGRGPRVPRNVNRIETSTLEHG